MERERLEANSPMGPWEVDWELYGFGIKTGFFFRPSCDRAMNGVDGCRLQG